MDKKKLSPQVFAFGQIYKVITDVCPQAEISNPEMYPMRTYTLSILKMNQNRASSDKVQRELAELSSEIDPDDWEGLFNVAMPMELRNEFFMGYYRGAEKTKLAAVRKSKGLTQVDLAEMTEVGQKDISRWETSAVKPNADNLKKLCSALECNIEDII